MLNVFFVFFFLKNRGPTPSWGLDPVSRLRILAKEEDYRSVNYGF